MTNTHTVVLLTSRHMHACRYCVSVYGLCFGTFRAFLSRPGRSVAASVETPPSALHILRPGVSRVLFSFFGGGEPLEVSTGVNRRTPRAHCCRFYTIRLPAGRVSQNLYSKFLSLHLDYLKVRGSARSKEFSFVFIFVLLGV